MTQPAVAASSDKALPRVVADGPLNPVIARMLEGHMELLSWSVGETGSREPVAGIYAYGHLTVDGAMMDRLPGLKVISNYGVGVDHIDVKAAALDVTDPEPLPRGHPLLSMDNVVIVPHLGSATHQTRTRMAEVSVENLLAGIKGEKLVVEVVG